MKNPIFNFVIALMFVVAAAFAQEKKANAPEEAEQEEEQKDNDRQEAYNCSHALEYAFSHKALDSPVDVGCDHGLLDNVFELIYTQCKQILQ